MQDDFAHVVKTHHAHLSFEQNNCRYLDYINLMAYDLHGSWEDITGHNAPLYSHSGETGDSTKLNVVSNKQNF